MDSEAPLKEEATSPRLLRSERAIHAAIEIYTRWQEERDRTPLDRVVGAEFRSRRYLNASERRWTAEALYGSVRYLRRQRRLLEILGREDSPETRIRLWAEADAGDETVLAAFDRLPDTGTPRDYLRITLSFSDDMATTLEDLLGMQAIAAGKAFNTQAPTTLRLNPLRADRQRVRTALPAVTPTEFSPWGLELPHRVNIFDQPGFRAGWYEVQEEASQLAALLTNVHPGQTVVDVGAGAGGKTLALAALMENKGRLVALDIALPRLEELQDRAHRAGVSKMEIIELDANAEGIWRRDGEARKVLLGLNSTADHVLLDAPCTGSGVLRRSPDTKWRLMDRPVLARLQSTLLAQSSLLVAPGGYLHYITCSFEPEQNERIVEAFLASAEGKEFSIVPVVGRLLAACGRAEQMAKQPPRARRNQEEEATPKPPPPSAEMKQRFAPLTEGPFLRTWPHRDGLDAFFGATLQRKT
ncbi:MAG: tRNA and rRNA cytosine-C5-methylase [Chthonomonadaceae bacterium]|nr:tRNA and rRNA cytosine-C5-methylase [Chthonomonadaceae bacterium]